VAINKQKLTAEEAAAALIRLQCINDIGQCRADLLIEAVVENAAVKIDLFNQLATHNNETVVFASNTSSISITQLQHEILCPQRVVGMHFFNPAPLMKLVEVVKGEYTSNAIADKVMEVAKQMNKVPVLCNDAPGFIVNRVARHYYLEAMQMVEQGIADIATVDAVMEATGFRMGPFKLMDLIGMDVNLAVSDGLYRAFNQAERFKPAAMQIAKVNNRELGCKTGKGFYSYPHSITTSIPQNR
jgi:3-hydroxybutyryl-CoA dehydrogenase